MSVEKKFFLHYRGFSLLFNNLTPKVMKANYFGTKDESYIFDFSKAFITMKCTTYTFSQSNESFKMKSTSKVQKLTKFDIEWWGKHTFNYYYYLGSSEIYSYKDLKNHFKEDLAKADFKNVTIYI